MIDGLKTKIGRHGKWRMKIERWRERRNGKRGNSEGVDMREVRGRRERWRYRDSEEVKK